MRAKIETCMVRVSGRCRRSLRKAVAAEDLNLDRFIAGFRRIALLPPAGIDAQHTTGVQ
jgi:hypothetical protein